MPDPTTSGGTAQSHPQKDPLPILVAPTTQTDLNTVKAFLIPVGCWRIDDVRFAFDSSVVHPDAKPEMGMLATLRKAHAGAPLSLFGHADPTGTDDYNKTLSGRRATTIYALLTRDTAKWETLYSTNFGGDSWGLKSIQLMVNEVTGSSLAVDGIAGPLTNSAISNYQQSKGLPQSGSADQSTRAKLFADYMDKVCVDGTGAKYQLQKSDFLAKGADPDGKGDFQGCGEFNPFVVFSNAETTQYQSDHTTRDSENAPNRRVMGLLFKPGTVISTTKWPCPKASEDKSGCIKRFWKDGDTRRNPQDARRTFDDTKNTYACRFYHRLFVLSPCGAGSGVLPTVLQINATIEATKEIRAGSTKKRTNPALRSSTLSVTSLTDNPPGAFLVQGCKDVDLEAVISGPFDVTWTVTPTDNTNPAPTITPVAGSANNTKAKLSAAQGGSFSVTASIGSSKVVWNVVFVSVKPSTEGVVIDLRAGGYADGFTNAPNFFPSDGNMTRFTSGQFTNGQYCWEAFIPTIKLVGGGSDGKLGIDKVVTHYLQNITGDSLSGHYQGGATAAEAPQSGGTVVGFPITDSNGDADTTPFADFSVTIGNPASDSRSWRAGDAPAGQFPRVHNGKLLQTIDGSIDFRAAIASTTVDAPNSIVVNAEMTWSAHYDGTVATSGAAGTYTPTPNAARTTGDTQISLVSAATNGQDAADAGYETFEPRYNNGRATIFH